MISTSLFFCAVWTVVAGAAQVIQQSVQTAIAGEKVTLSCRLAESYDVVQVTWQREHGKDRTNIATHSMAHGPKVLGTYQDRVHISPSGLNASTMTFHAVTVKDESCYTCIFNTFPLGSISGRTCLKVYALTKPKVDVKRIPNPDSAGKEILKVSCSVTGRPAPVITWQFPEYLQIMPVRYFIYHPNQTVTVVSNFTHMSPKDLWENPVNCLIQHPSLNSTQELTLPEDAVEQAKRKVPRIPVIISSCILVVVFILGILAFSDFNCWRSASPQDKKQDLLHMILPRCPGNLTCGQYSCTRNQVPVKAHHQNNFLGG